MDNINVAIPFTGSKASNMSAEEFQTLLTSWFEEKGIITDLRSQLRFKMINILKNTAIGRNISKRSVSHHSLSKQAINLIVAEFLMVNKYHYSLSVFNTEAALTNVFPEYLKFDDIQEPFRYSFENLSNIFELIGVQRNSEFGKEALNSYCNNSDSSILSCLVNSICKLSNRMRRRTIQEEIECIDFDKESNFVKQLGGILVNSETCSDNIGQILKNIESIHNVEIKMMEDRYRRSISELKIEVSRSIEKLQEVNKEKGVSENKLMKVVGEYNAMKVQMKNLVKEKLQNERKEQLMNLKKIEQNVSEQVAPKVTLACSSQHCSDRCEKNINLVEVLQDKNRELYGKYEALSEEFSHLTKNYDEIVGKVPPVCSRQHCSDKCEKNMVLLNELKERTQELSVKSETQSEEVCHLLKKYSEKILEKFAPACPSQHCTNKCEKNMILVDELTEKNRELSRNSEIQSEEIRHLLEKYNEQIIQRSSPICSNQHCSNECRKHMNLVDELQEKNRELSRRCERESEELYCLLRRYKEQLIQKVTNVCSIQHCSDKCEKNINLLDELRVNNLELSRKNAIQSEEIFHLSEKYKELLHDFLNSQRKVSYLKAKANSGDTHSRIILKQTVLEDSKVPKASLANNTIDSDSSTSVTEEILREARLRLQILEEESNKIEEKFNNTQVDSSKKHL
ncbi:unnamed protein product [Phaedon cochleariae]|uniref:LisH domain-containing protein n=1 Tax=Phaedon cochleariae TaxID=80249 RepID=A0A9N9X2Z5_PHACE|nr:unnamed protein product [Phaedon cochleariae]